MGIGNQSFHCEHVKQCTTNKNVHKMFTKFIFVLYLLVVDNLVQACTIQPEISEKHILGNQYVTTRITAERRIQKIYTRTE